MATQRVIYFSGEQELKNIHAIPNEEFRNQYPGIRGCKYDGYMMFVGQSIDGAAQLLPVTRRIFFKQNPSLHKCDSRCRNAKGGTCECSCRGKYHGVSH